MRGINLIIIYTKANIIHYIEKYFIESVRNHEYNIGTLICIYRNGCQFPVNNPILQ